MRHLRRCLPLELDRHRRGHQPARAGQDVHRLLAVLGLLPARRPPVRGTVAAVDRRGRRGRRGPTGPGSLGLVGHVLEDQWWPAGDGLGAVVDSYAVRAARSPTTAGRRRGQRPPHRAAGRRRDRWRPRVQAESRSRRAVEGRRHHRDNGRRDQGRLGQLLQPDDGAGRVGSVAYSLPPEPRSRSSARRARCKVCGRCSRAAGPPARTGSMRSC